MEVTALTLVSAMLCLGVVGATDLEVFPPSFLFGAATSSYQIEGAWNESGKGESIWDRLTHTRRPVVVDGSTGDIAADSYHMYEKDVQALQEMGMRVYRFSISWSRILPTGDVKNVNQDGIDYYNNLINELLANDIQPMVTMYHWDLPQKLQDIGGWANSQLSGYFEDYAGLLYSSFGDRVKWWITFNEPSEITRGYSDNYHAPLLVMNGVGEYLAAHTILMAHARAYHLYDNKYRRQQQGMISISLLGVWYESASGSATDNQAANWAQQFELGWFAHPIFRGDYPEAMKVRIERHSQSEGRPLSRLPGFDKEWINYINGTWDFFALNHYTTMLVRMGDSGLYPSRQWDSGASPFADPRWPKASSSWLNVVPWGFRKLLKFIMAEYNNPPIFVTANGFSDQGEIHDAGRISYLVSYLREMLKAHYLDGANVIGYTAWSLLDGFQWQRGYTERFGLYHVDFTDPKRRRTPKDSAKVMAGIIRDSRLPPGYSGSQTFHSEL